MYHKKIEIKTRWLIGIDVNNDVPGGKRKIRGV
jgi:hypothetical protein